MAAYEESAVGSDQVFDIGSQLRLRFSVTKDNGLAVMVRFDPWKARFNGPGFDFTWVELMFRPGDCLSKILHS